jgi:hypothetical protein
MTFDIFEHLESYNAICSPFNEEQELTDEEEIDLHHIWDDRGRKIRLLGSLQRQHALKLQTSQGARVAAKAAMKAAAKAERETATLYPRDTTPKRPWTEEELNRRDGFIPDERLYRHTELVPLVDGEPADGSGFFSLEAWDGQ